MSWEPSEESYREFKQDENGELTIAFSNTEVIGDLDKSVMVERQGQA